jgi:glycosyltransferase involved in cell wall biosynthesis
MEYKMNKKIHSTKIMEYKMNKKIHLLLVSKSTAGVGAYVHTLVKHLDHQKFDITVACLSENGKEFAAELKRQYGIQAFSLAMNRYKINPLTDLIACIQLAKTIRKEKYDVIHAHASKPGFLTRIAAIGSGVPVIYSPHSFAFHEGTNKIIAFLTALLEKIASFFTTKIIAVAKHEKELALSYGVGEKKLYEVVPTGIDATAFRLDVNVAKIKTELNIPIESNIVGAVGRLAVQKQPLDFVKVAQILHKEFPTLHFVWVGSGPLENEAKKLTQELKLDAVVHWLGHRDDVYALYRIFNIFILLSRWEANPLVILEAFASGVPVVATANLGTNELITSGYNGIIVPVGDMETTANVIKELLQNPEKVNLLRTSATAQINADYTLALMIKKIEKIYIESAILN